MKNILIVGRHNVGEKNDARLLAEAINQAGDDVSVSSAYFEEFVFVLDNTNAFALLPGEHERSLSDFDTVVLINWSHSRLYSDVAHSLALIAQRAGVKVWNQELITARSSTKLSQLVMLSESDVPVPATIYSLTPSLLRDYSDKVGVPFIAKDPLASRGRDNYLCQSWDEFTDHSTDTSTFLIQEFVPNDHSDLRMFVADYEPVLVIHRHGSADSHLNNISHGAQASLVELDQLPDELRIHTREVARLFERELCGIDFMQNSKTGEYIFLEVNTTPQIVNGTFVEEKAAALAKALAK